MGLLVGVIPTAVELSSGDPDVGTAIGLTVGSAIVTAAVVVGLFLLLQEDGATFSVTPLPSESPTVLSEEWR